MQNTFDFLWQMLDEYLARLDMMAIPVAAWVGLALLVAVWLGERLYRLGASRTTGYWLCGALIGSIVAATAHPVASGLGPPALSSMAGIAQAMFNLALGWLLVELGQRMDWRWLWRNKALAVTALLEFVLTWAASATVLSSLGFEMLPAGVMATLVAHSSPVVLASLLQSWRAQGQVTERTLHVGSINTLLTVLMLPLVLAWAGAYAQGAQAGSGLPQGVLRSGLELAQPLWEVVASVALGYALGWLLSRLGARRSALAIRSAMPMINPMVASFSSEWIYLAGAVCLAVGCAQWWNISALVACLALGLSLRTRAVHAHAQDSHAVSALAQVLMFVVAGASLPWLAWAGLGVNSVQPALSAQVLVLASLLLVIRLGAKTLACTLTAHWAGLRWVQGLALGLMLQPLSMTGLVLWGMAASVLSGPLATLFLAYLLMLCVSDVLSPWAMQLVLRSIREVEPLPEPATHSGLQTQSSVRQHRIDTDSLPAAALGPERPIALREALAQPQSMRHPQPQ